MDDVASATKNAVPNMGPASDLTGEALLRSEDFVPFALDCFARAVREAAAGEAAAMRHGRPSTERRQQKQGSQINTDYTD
jgi:hypothetical protein